MNKKREPVGIYLHFPFCVRKCKYCDFLSGPADASVRHSYAEALCREISAFAADTSKGGMIVSECDRKNGTFKSDIIEVDGEGGGDVLSVDTIFLGGGTPSVMDPADLTRVMEAVRENFDVMPDAEISMEMNPGTFREDLMSFVRTHINRVSLGLQSADDAELKSLGRIHTFAEFARAFSALREAGIANINVDLMSAIPGQTIDSWERSLLRVARMEPEHISSYSLIIEEGTPFFDLFEAGRLALPDEDTEREMYYMTERLLSEYGYRRYEISNYAKPGHECRHNARYWRRMPYVGFGIGAASLFDETRWSNTRSLDEYLAHSGEIAVTRREITQLTRRERMEEFMFLGLRMMDGVSADAFARNFGTEIGQVYGDTICRLQAEGLMYSDGDRFMLTPRGVDISNAVLSEFLEPGEA